MYFNTLCKSYRALHHFALSSPPVILYPVTTGSIIVFAINDDKMKIASDLFLTSTLHVDYEMALVVS
jgi:uncharacterized protein (AIM24 family)